MADKDININLNVNSDKYESNIKKAEKATDKFNDELKDIPKTAKKAENALDKVSDEAKKLEKSAKAGRLGVEALKDKLGALPVVGQTLSRSLDGVEGSFLSVAKAALPVAGIAGGLATVGGAAILSYKNSEKLRNELDRFKDTSRAIGVVNDYFGKLGDSIGNIIENFNDANEAIQILNGQSLDNLYNELDDIRKVSEGTIQSLKTKLDIVKQITNEGDSERRQLEIKKAIQVVNEQTAEEQAIAVKKERDEKKKLLDQTIRELNITIKKRDQYAFMSRDWDIYNEKVAKQTDLMNKLEEEVNKLDGQYEVLTKSAGSAIDKQNELNNELNNKSEKKTTDKNKKDELKEAREQLKALKEEQEILNDTVLDSEEAEEKKRSDLQAQLPLLEKIYVLEQKRGEASSNTLDELKSVKAFLQDEESEVEKLKIAYDDLVKSQNIRDALIDSSNIEEARQKEIQDTQAQITALENLYEAQVKAGEPAEETLETIKQLKDYLNDLTKETLNWKDHLTTALSITSSIGNLFGTAITAALDFSKIDLAPFDKAIEEARSKLDAFNKWKEEQEEAEEEKSLEDYEERIALLDEEIEYAKEIGDKMSEIALENKKKEIQKEMDEEQKRIDKEKAINEEEKRLQHELALAEYNKEYANWQNQVKSAQTQKTKAIADSIIMPAQAIGNAAIGCIRCGWSKKCFFCFR